MLFAFVSGDDRTRLEERRKIGECDMEKFGTPDRTENTIAKLEIDGGHRRRNREEIR